MQLALKCVCVLAYDLGLGVNPVPTEKVQAITCSSTETERDGTETQGGGALSRTHPG